MKFKYKSGKQNSGGSSGGCLEDSNDCVDVPICGSGRGGLLAVHFFGYGASVSDCAGRSSRGKFAIGAQHAGQL